MTLSLAGLMGAAFVRWSIPLRTLTPTGESGVGNKSWVWKLPSASSTGARVEPVEVQLWYPIVDAFSPSLPADRPLPIEDRPVVMLIHGYAGSRHSLLSIAHQLASDGFVVVAADHTEIAFSPSRRSVPDPDLRAELWRTRSLDPPRRLQERLRPDQVRSVAAEATAVAERTHLVLRHQAPRTAYVGFGLGGLAAMHACEQDPTCATSVTIEASPTLVTPPPSHPVLALYAGGVPTGEPSSKSQTRIAFPDAGSLDLSDLPLHVRGVILRRFVSRADSTGRGSYGLRASRAAISGWLEHHLNGEPLDLTARLAPWPDASIQLQE